MTGKYLRIIKDTPHIINNELLLDEKYDKILQLNCSDCSLKNIRNYPSGLEFLDCSWNYLENFENLPNIIIK